jgi:hypothetical protein
MFEGSEGIGETGLPPRWGFLESASAVPDRNLGEIFPNFGELFPGVELGDGSLRRVSGEERVGDTWEEAEEVPVREEEGPGLLKLKDEVTLDPRTLVMAVLSDVGSLSFVPRGSSPHPPPPLSLCFSESRLLMALETPRWRLATWEFWRSRVRMPWREDWTCSSFS